MQSAKAMLLIVVTGPIVAISRSVQPMNASSPSEVTPLAENSFIDEQPLKARAPIVLTLSESVMIWPESLPPIGKVKRFEHPLNADVPISVIVAGNEIQSSFEFQLSDENAFAGIFVSRPSKV